MGAEVQLDKSFPPGVRAMIPLLYAAWSDRSLSVAEVHALRQQAAALTFLTEEDKPVLLRWSDPALPPTRDLFKLWEIETKRAAAALPDHVRGSLTDLSLLLGREAAGAPDSPEAVAWDTPERRNELQALEEAIGPISDDTYRNLFPHYDAHQREAEEVARAPFATADLQAVLDAPYAETKQRLRELLTSEGFERRTLRVKEEYREQVLIWLRRLAERGLGALALPEAYGGEDDTGKYNAVFEMLAFYDLSLTIKFGVQFGLWGGSVYSLGTKKHHELYLRRIGNMELPGCFAMTETGHGSNVRGLETTAVYDPEEDEFVIHTPHNEAGKEYIGNALHGRIGTVFAQLLVGGENHGVHAFVVPLRDEEDILLPGIRVADNGYKLGLNGVDNGRLWFNQVRVPRANLLDRFGQVDENGQYSSPIENPSRRFFTMLGTLVGGRVAVPRAGLSAAKAALAIAIRYALRRRQFAPTPVEPETIILDYPSHQRRLLPLLAKAYALHFALDHLLDRFIHRTEEDMREIETLAAGMKAYATWFTTHTIQECREACGGKGYLTENRFADLKADTDIFTTFEGDNTVLMQLVAKGVLSDFQKEFAEEGNRAVLRYVGRRIATVLTEQNPITIRNTDREHLTDAEFQLGAFRFHEQRLTMSLARRLRALVKSGMSAYDAGLQGQTHMLALGEAFVERVVLEQFIAAVERQPDGPVRTSLDRLRQLYALHTIENHKAWFLEQDYISGNKSKAIRVAVDTLCAEVRPEAGALVEAFGIPDELLGAPIAV